MTDDLAALRDSLDSASKAWLAAAEKDAASADTTPQSALPVWEIDFAEAGRRCHGAQDAARIILLHAARPDATTLTRLYTHGSAAERRAVLRALNHLPHLAPSAVLPLVEDALRANDSRLIAAAVGSGAAAHLDAHVWRHAVLKCLFIGVPLDAVADLEERASGDLELVRMLTDYSAERAAAGRPIPEDLDRALRLATQES